MKSSSFYGSHFDLPSKKRRLDELIHLESDPSFWNDPKRARLLSQEKSRIDSEISGLEALEEELLDSKNLWDLACSEQDQTVLQDIVQSLALLQKKVSELEFQRLFNDPVDPKNAVITINAGAGGTESQDWAQMLLRMLMRYCEKKGFKANLLDALPGEEAGIKNATLMVSGPFAYGQLKSEAGVHRLVRISPFDSNKRRHTSFSSVFVSPEIDDDFEVVIQPSDLRVDVYRAGGKGGQGVNTTDSAVRITHLPSGIVVTCQQERSQIKNRDLAMKVLKSRLYEKHLEEERKKQSAIEDAKTDIAWGHQIRSYVLHPYKMVKDHRTGENTSSAEQVLDGELDAFTKAYLVCRITGDWVKAGQDPEI